MKNHFIELTEPNGSKILVNVLHIAWIEPDKNGAVIKSNFEHYSLPKKVLESYDQIKMMITQL